MTWSIEVAQARSSPAVSLDEARAQLNVQDEDDTLSLLIDAATSHVERLTGFYVGQQTLVQHQDEFAEESVRLMAAPVTNVTDIHYDDADGAQQTFTDFVTRTKANPPIVYSDSWPSTSSKPGSVRITMTAGEAATSDMKLAILMLCAHWYENREAVITGTIVTETPIGVDALLSKYKQFR